MVEHPQVPYRTLGYRKTGIAKTSSLHLRIVQHLSLPLQYTAYCPVSQGVQAIVLHD